MIGGTADVYSDFEQLNAYVYHSARGAVFDGLIWCLGPYVDDSRVYGFFRVLLARSTKTVVRWWLRLVSPKTLVHRSS
jgi:hypothetical protein